MLWPVALAVLSLQSAAPTYGTFTNDVVELLTINRTVPGTAENSLVHQGYRYLFSSPVTLEKFKANPRAYEVQLGGACGQLGELSTRGDTNHYLVSGRRLFIFSSEASRDAFKANPRGYLDSDDRAPTAIKAARDRGAGLVAQARTWAGLDNLGPQAAITFTVSQGTFSEVARVGPGTDYFEQTMYDGAGTGYEIRLGKAFAVANKGASEELLPSWRRALERRRARNFVYLLMAKPTNRNFFAYRSSNGGVATVEAYVDRVLTTLRIEEGSGRLLGTKTRQRAENGLMGWVDRTFTQFATIDGVTLPIAWTATFDGADAPIFARRGIRVSLSR